MLHHPHHIHKIHKKKKRTFFDFVLYFFIFTTPLFELSQAAIIYSNKSSEGVSLYTWAYFAVSSFVWLLYGLHQKIRPVIIAYSLYLVIELIVVAGIVKYS